MKKPLLSLCLTLLFAATVSAIDLGGLEKIGPVASFVKGTSSITLNCRDNSQVQITVMAPDLVRVRASFKEPMPERDHSWAIAKTSWGAPRWGVKEDAEHITLITDELEYLPEGTWVDYWTGKKHSGRSFVRVEAMLETVPMFVRAGSIIPMWPEMNYVGEKPADPVTFEVYTDEKSEAATSLYEDDGASVDYKKGALRRTRVVAGRSSSGVQIEISAPEGTYNPGERSLLFVVKSTAAASRVLVDGKTVSAVKADEKAHGWYREGGDVAVRIRDDGKAHKIQVQ
jgi:Domain of unknown function (DUF5110)/Domain of unknown function (DUF4968)